MGVCKFKFEKSISQHTPKKIFVQIIKKKMFNEKETFF